VPFIARWPGRIEAGSVSNQLLCQIDLLTTLAALSGSEAKGPGSLDALPTLLGLPEKPVREQVVLAPLSKRHLALRDGDWLYIADSGGGGFGGSKPGDHGLGGGAALKFAHQTHSDYADGKLKPDAPQQQLYNIAADPSQTKNVIREHPEIAKRLAKRLTDVREP
jgi:arylsulfatase A